MKKRNITSISNLVNKTNREIATMSDFYQIFSHVIRVANRFKFTQNQANEWYSEVLSKIRQNYSDNIYYDEFDEEVAEIGNYVYNLQCMYDAVKIPCKRSKKQKSKIVAYCHCFNNN